MFDSLPVLPPDSILGLAAACRADPNPDKVDLTLGVYMDETGLCPVFEAVQQAQQALVSEEQTKVYMPPQGDPDYLTGIRSLVFGEAGMADLGDRISAVQTPGGCGAVRLGAEVLHAAAPDATVWVSDPTWPVHIPLMGSVGLQFKTYRYYSADMKGLDFDAMLADLEAAQAGDVVLLHGCCHNPSGADLTPSQWQSLCELALKQNFTIFIDLAYQGMGDGIEEDVLGVRLLAESLPELIVVSSCSKNFGLYRERTGAITLICESDKATSAASTLLAAAARANYSMPPDHGAAIVELITEDPTLNQMWQEELKRVRDRINELRFIFSESLRKVGVQKDFSFIQSEKGMFSFLGVNQNQIQELINKYAIYLVDSSRINVASINKQNIDYVTNSVAEVISKG